MQIFSLNELSKMYFLVHNPCYRAPQYKEGTMYHIAEEDYRKYMGILYLSNCDMITTSLVTNTQYKFKKGSLVLLPKYSKYYSTFTNVEKTAYSFVCVNTTLLSFHYDDIIVGSEPVQIFEKAPRSTAEIMRSIVEEKSSSILLMSKMYLLLNSIFENMPSDEIKKTDIAKTLDYTDIENKSNKELAAQLNVSVSTLTRIFKKYYNTTPAAYSLKQKIKAAEFRLVNTDMPIGQIASNLGFNSPEHFSRIFKKHNGLSPVKYRNTHNQRG